MKESSVIKIRYMQANEVVRVGELIRALQRHQKMTHCPRIPNDDDMIKEITHKDEKSGEILPNRFGTYVAVAIDTSKLNDTKDFSYVVGYLVYSQVFSIILGRHLWVNSFFIEEEYRNFGLGTKLMNFVQLHGRATGNSIVDIPYMNNNIIGQKFYSRFGSVKVNDEYQIMCLKIN